MYILFDDSIKTTFVADSSAFKGVKHVADTVCSDIELVCGYRPVISEVSVADFASEDKEGRVFVATLGNSDILDDLAGHGLFNTSLIRGKREVFSISVIGRTLVIAGSDLRGTIYGLFELSRMCGVSPLVYWGDVVPKKCRSIVLPLNSSIVSKEPSILYRGFFINDEWPAFGNWCNTHFGGFTKECYEQVFMLLLRLRGNYMWPAMWSSTFSADGPGLANAELANELGVIMGASHHEPMCRAGEEWQHIYKEYGDDNTWSFISNRDAITDFWRDGILRNRDFENIITIGMRGECDSKLLGENATLKDNIEVIKDAITTQRRLISENLDPDPDRVPQMLAIYKEVEDYYYGDSGCVGLKEWDVLKNVIFMLCEDNFGNTRGLPEQKDLETHPGGYGMYYHFDYHGAPISYEWQNCVRLSKTRDQMTTAYDFGVRKLWIVNVGDIKGVEYPLEYFMDLAYDYEAWSGIDKADEFARRFVDEHFGYGMTKDQKRDLLTLMNGYTRWSTARKIEAVSPDTYHPVNFNEALYVASETGKLIEIADRLHESLGSDIKTGFDSIFYYPAAAELNVIRMNAFASLNRYYASKGSLKANEYAELVNSCIEADKRYVSLYDAQLSGKWQHMMDSKHVWFKTWCDQGWSYPDVKLVSEAEEDKSFDPSADVEKYKSFDFIKVSADSFTSSHEVNGEGFKVISNLGRFGAAIKAFPQTRVFDGEDIPFVSYDIDIPDEGDYDVYITFMARNPVVKGNTMTCSTGVNNGKPELLYVIDKGYFTEWMNRDWNTGVMTGVRTVKTVKKFNKGHNTFEIYAGDPNVIVEQFFVCRAGAEVPSSYLGPQQR